MGGCRLSALTGLTQLTSMPKQQPPQPIDLSEALACLTNLQQLSVNHCSIIWAVSMPSLTSLSLNGVLNCQALQACAAYMPGLTVFKIQISGARSSGSPNLHHHESMLAALGELCSLRSLELNDAYDIHSPQAMQDTASGPTALQLACRLSALTHLRLHLRSGSLLAPVCSTHWSG